MKTIIAILALTTVLADVPVAADDSVDCFYESNASNPLCKK